MDPRDVLGYTYAIYVGTQMRVDNYFRPKNRLVVKKSGLKL
jgi:hypothetical protein